MITNSYLNNYSYFNGIKTSFTFTFFSNITYYNLIEVLSRENVINFEFIKLESNHMLGFNCYTYTTPIMSYYESRFFLINLMNIIKQNGYTTSNSNVSINIYNIESCNFTKLINEINEDYIFELYPDRKDSVYCKSIKNITFVSNLSSITDNINTISFKNNSNYGLELYDDFIQFNYIGGKDYEKNIDKILELYDYIISKIESSKYFLTSMDNVTLQLYLDNCINIIDSYKDLANVNLRIPNLRIEVDKCSDAEVNKLYYASFYTKIIDFTYSVVELPKCIVNYDNETKQVEVVNADISVLYDMVNFTFINCTIENGDFTNCFFHNCKLKNVYLKGCNIKCSDIDNSYLLECNVLECNINNTNVIGGLLNSNMSNGLVKSVNYTENSIFDNVVKI